MSQAKKVALLLGVFFFGCAAERLVVVPPARAGTNPTRWEHVCKFVDLDEAKATTTTNQYGEQGWELVTVATLEGRGNTNAALWCFKRPLL